MLNYAHNYQGGRCPSTLRDHFQVDRDLASNMMFENGYLITLTMI